MSGRGAELQRLWREVEQTRADYREELRGRVESPAAIASRHRALAALEDYVSALEDCHFPVPPQVHRDLKMLRCLCTPATHRRR